MVQFMLRMTSALLFGMDDAAFAEQLGRLIDRWTHCNHEIGMGALVSAPQFAQGYDSLLQQAEELEQSIRELFSRHRSGPQGGLNILSLLMDNVSSERQLEKLQAELAAEVAGEIPQLEELERLPYLDAVIRESMRILPASSYSQRFTAAPVELGGMQLSQGTVVIFSQYMTHHRADLYERPDEFRPERWQSINPSPYAYLPFGAGPRMCIGAPLAMVEIRTALTMILRRFAFQIEPQSTVNGNVISTMLGPTSPIHARLMPGGQLPQTVPVYGTIHDLLHLPPDARPVVQRKAA
jgi:cytochrome P450